MAGLGDAAYQTADRLEYMSGFGNMFATEALPGALPVGQNSPQHCPYGLYAELLSGTAFTASRPLNRRTWLYRIRPSAAHGPMRKISDGLLCGDFDGKIEVPPDRLRWDPAPLPSSPTDFVAGLITMGGNGSPEAQTGCAVHIYAANRSMTDRFFCNSDGELLLVPQLGRLRLLTEMGQLDVAPLEVATIPRGVRFRVELPDGPSRGYVCENFGPALTLPNLGPIGSNGLANPRDFLTPVARYEDRTGEFELVTKFLGRLWSAKIDRSPLDVVAWHGNCAPYKYDLQRFNAIGSISFDHPDPSIYLVLHSPYDNSGTSNIDFVVFAPRWMVSENTFRPPWFHRNIASEFMGLIHGTYDAKAEGFVPGGASLHNCMTAHGPDAATFDRAIQADTQTPHRITGSMAFMFETRTVIRPTRHALTAPQLQADYGDCWSGLAARFDPRRP